MPTESDETPKVHKAPTPLKSTLCDLCGWRPGTRLRWHSNGWLCELCWTIEQSER